VLVTKRRGKKIVEFKGDAKARTSKVINRATRPSDEIFFRRT
jgi:hypothetical protein